MLVNTHRRRSIGSKQGAGSSERASAILSSEYMGELASKVHFVMENTEEKKYWK